MITIRQASKPQRATAAAIDRELFPDDTPHDFGPDRVWVAVDAGAVVGFACARVLMARRVVYLSRVGVRAAYQRRGLAHALLRARMRWARDMAARGHVDRVITYTSAENVASMNNLIKGGFRMYTPADEDAWAGLVCWERRVP